MRPAVPGDSCAVEAGSRRFVLPAPAFRFYDPPLMTEQHARDDRPTSSSSAPGPIGLELAVALKRAGVDYLHFDAKQIGYTISWFAPQTRFFSSNERIAIAGVPLQTPDGSSRRASSTWRTSAASSSSSTCRSTPTSRSSASSARAGDGFELTTQPAAGARTLPLQQADPRHRRHRPPAHGSTSPAKTSRTSATTSTTRTSTSASAC